MFWLDEGRRALWFSDLSRWEILELLCRTARAEKHTDDFATELQLIESLHELRARIWGRYGYP